MIFARWKKMNVWNNGIWLIESILPQWCLIKAIAEWGLQYYYVTEGQMV